MNFLLYSAVKETGYYVPLRIKRGRGNRPDEASATCATACGANPGRMPSEGRKELV
jgi:hypothetical protein